MSEAEPSKATSLPIEVLRRQNEICDRFEAEYRAGRQPKPEQFVDGLAGAERAALLRELLLLESVYQGRPGTTTASPDMGTSQKNSGLPHASTLPERIGRLGDFVIVREIGRGGMGVVYEANQTSLNRQVALKVLASAVGLTPKAVQRFQREAEAAAKLHHTNIVSVYTTGEENGAHFYAMELIEGPSIDLVIRQLRQPTAATSPAATPVDGSPASELLGATGPFTSAPTPSPSSSGGGLSSSSLNSGSGYYDTVARLIAEVADALDYAHNQGVVHRDIKPSNLLLSPAGRLSISDFGLARVLDQPGMTITGEMVGTPRYMSPEQITAGRVAVDHRTDIYSLGATLYELLTLQPPFLAEQRDQLLGQIIQKEPRRPRQVNAKVPLDLETICLKALEKDPDRRYQTAGQMAEDLRRYINRFAILARRPSSLARLQKWVKRNPVLAVTISIALLCAALAGGLAHRAHEAERQRLEDQAKHDEELLNEKRGSAMSRASVAARLQDIEGAQQAIFEAEKLGCPPGEIRMLQGQLELYRGRVAEAIDQIKVATAYLPESVAAWSLLSLAYDWDAQPAESNRALGEARHHKIITEEDRLFLAHAESRTDPERGKKTLDQGSTRRGSVLETLVRTEVLRSYLVDFPEIELAKQIRAEVEVLKRQFPENPIVLGMSALVHATCYHIGEEFNDQVLRQAAWDVGTKDAEALAQHRNHAKAMADRWVFLKETNQEELGVADMRRFCNETRDNNAVLGYGVYLYKRGAFREAVDVFAKFQDRKNENLGNLFRVIALAELDEDRAQANTLIEEIAKRDPKEWDRFNSQLILRFLGRKQEAVRMSKNFLKSPEWFPPNRQEAFRRSLEYCAEELTADALISSIGTNRGDLCNAQLCIALTLLADGDRDGARDHLKKCVSTREIEILPYDIAQMTLSRMDKDPNWPPWIKAAK